MSMPTHPTPALKPLGRMIQRNAPQGSPEWLHERMRMHNASEAGAALNCSPYMTRDQLLFALHTGTRPEPTEIQLALFAEGHRCEALYRPFAEEVIGEPLYPISGHLEGTKLRASFDGLTIARKRNFEHKLLNEELRKAMPGSGLFPPEECENDARNLPLFYRVQMEQQCMVSGAELVLFVASKWDGDDLVDDRCCWYQPDPELRVRIQAAWAQVELDLASYVPTTPVVKLTAEAIKQLPALVIRVRGEVAETNLSEWQLAAKQHIESVNEDLQEDQHFVDAQEAIKWCDDGENKLRLAKQLAQAQMTSVDEVFRTVDVIIAMLAAKRIRLTNKVKIRNEEIKSEAVARGQKNYDARIAELEKKVVDMLPPTVKWKLPAAPIDLWAAIKNKRTPSTLANAVNSCVAKGLEDAQILTMKIMDNLGMLGSKAKEHTHLFADWRDLVLKDGEALELMIDQRIRVFKEAEDKRKADADEAARLAAAPPPTPAPTPVPAPTAAPAQALTYAPRTVTQSPAGQATGTQFVNNTVDGLPSGAPRIYADEPREQLVSNHDRINDVGAARLHAAFGPVNLSTEPTVKTGDVGALLSFNLTIEFMEKICGESPHADGARKLFSEAQVDAILGKLLEHVTKVRADFRRGHANKAPSEIVMQPLKSNQLKAAGYDLATSTLKVEFVSGGIYFYSAVPRDVFSGLMTAASAGSYFTTYVRNKFVSRKD